MKLIQNTSTSKSKTHIQHKGRVAICKTELYISCCKEFEGDISQVTCKRCLKIKESDDKHQP